MQQPARRVVPRHQTVEEQQSGNARRPPSGTHAPRSDNPNCRQVAADWRRPLARAAPAGTARTHCRSSPRPEPQQPHAGQFGARPTLRSRHPRRAAPAPCRRRPDHGSPLPRPRPRTNTAAITPNSGRPAAIVRGAVDRIDHEGQIGVRQQAEAGQDRPPSLPRRPRRSRRKPPFQRRGQPRSAASSASVTRSSGPVFCAHRTVCQVAESRHDLGLRRLAQQCGQRCQLERAEPHSRRSNRARSAGSSRTVTCTAASSSCAVHHLAVLVQPGEPRAVLRRECRSRPVPCPRRSARRSRLSASASPSPVIAETATAPGTSGTMRRRPAGRPCSAPRSCAPASRHPACRRPPCPPAPRSRRRAAPSLSGCAASRTCRMTSASATSSSVARNASTSSCGSSLMKPTVSDRMTRRPDGRRSPRMVGSSVANSWSRARHLGAGQRVEQRRLAGVGVADQRDHRERHAPPRGAVQAAGAAHLLQILLQPHDALADQPAVGLDLRLAGAAEEAEAAALPLQMGPGPHQARCADIPDAPARPAACLRVVAARSPKMSRIRPVRSMTLQPQARSRLRCCTGDSAASTMATATSCSAIACLAASTWPSPSSVDGRRDAQRQDRGMHDDQSDRGGQPDRLGQPLLGRARFRIRPARRRHAVRPFPRQDDGGPGRARPLGAVHPIRQRHGRHSPAAGVSLPCRRHRRRPRPCVASNSWIGAPGITVLIACL